MATPGKRLRELANAEQPLQMVGAVNAISALLAKQAGLSALYLSGAGVANVDYGMPDLGITSLDNVLDSTRRITRAVDLPLLVDGDTGWGSVLNVAHTVRQLELAGAAGVHFEDQTFPKRCGHRVGKRLASIPVMFDRLTAALDARQDQDFVIMARTDAVSEEGINAAIARCKSYIDAGADMIFAEAITCLSDYERFAKELSPTPILANITEFGNTPLFSTAELHKAGVKIALYPLSAMRAMNYAANKVYSEIKNHGTQKACINIMQTREQLYALLDYMRYERCLDVRKEQND